MREWFEQHPLATVTICVVLALIFIVCTYDRRNR
jgi:negative regulator of sigma E activity